MMKFLTYLFSLLFSINAFSQSTLDGIIFDTDSSEVPFANIAIYKDGLLIDGTCSDFDGYYFIDSIESGIYNVKISYIGRNDVSKTLFFEDNKPREINFNFKYKYVTISQCYTIYTPRYPFKKIEGNFRIDDFDISELKIKKLDKIISSAPNVSFSKENELSFKGSRPGSEQYIIDGMRVNGKANIATSSINSIDIYQNGIPAKYGNTTSAVISISTKSYFDYFD